MHHYQLEFTLWAAIAAACSFSVATAQAQAPDEVTLVVHDHIAEDAGCWNLDVLRDRIEYYCSSAVEPFDVRVALDVDSGGDPEVQFLRGSTLVGLRRLAHLPEACAARRDVVAVSIALALEQDASLRPTAKRMGSSQYVRPLARDVSISAQGLATSDSAILEQTSESDAEPPADEQATATVASVATADPSGATIDRDDTESQGLTRSPDTLEDSVPSPPVTAFDHVDGLSFYLHLGVRRLLGALPASVWQGQVGLELVFSSDLSLEISALATTRADFDFAGGRSETKLLGGELLGCKTWRFGVVSAESCLGTSLAACSANGRGYAIDLPATTLLWAAGVARGALRWPDAAPIAVGLLLQLQANVVRPGLRVDGFATEVHTRWLGGAAGVEIKVALQ